MAQEIIIIHSDVTVIHPCFEIHNFSYLITKTSFTCVWLNIFLCSISAITTCGNLLVIISIMYFKQLHTPTNCLILSLAVADLLVGLLVFPLSMEFIVSYCLYNEFLLCKVRDNLDVTLSTASILNLCCISIDRYYAVCQPLSYHTKISVNVVVIMILSSWSVSVLVAIGFINVGLMSENCGENCIVNTVLASVLGSVFSFYVPVMIMLSVYLKIFLVAQRQVRSIKATAKSGEAASKMERKATKTLAIVLGVFLLCWCPFFLGFSLDLLNDVSVPVRVFETLMWLALSNSMLNPFIYALFYGWFRSAFRMIISGKIFTGDFANTKLL